MDEKIIALIFAVASILIIFTTTYLISSFKTEQNMIINSNNWFNNLIRNILKFVWPTALILAAAYFLTLENYVLFSCFSLAIVTYYVMLVKLIVRRHNDEISISKIIEMDDKKSKLFYYYLAFRKPKKWSKWSYLTILFFIVVMIISSGYLIIFRHFFQTHIIIIFFVSISLFQIFMFHPIIKDKYIFYKTLKKTFNKMFPGEKRNIFSIYTQDNFNFKSWKANIIMNISEENHDTFAEYTDMDKNANGRIVTGLLILDLYMNTPGNNNPITNNIVKMARIVAGKQEVKKWRKLNKMLSKFKRHLENMEYVTDYFIVPNHKNLNGLMDYFANNSNKRNTIQKSIKRIADIDFKINVKKISSEYLYLVSEILKNKFDSKLLRKIWKNREFIKLKKIKENLNRTCPNDDSEIHILIKYVKYISIVHKMILKNKNFYENEIYKSAKFELLLLKLHISSFHFLRISEDFPVEYTKYKG